MDQIAPPLPPPLSCVRPVSGRVRQERIRQIVVCHVAADFCLDPARLMASTRGAPHAALARQVAMYLAHVSFGLSFETTGRTFGRDRTTVSHGCRLVEDLRDAAAFDRRLAALELACRTAEAAATTAAMAAGGAPQ